MWSSKHLTCISISTTTTKYTATTRCGHDGSYYLEKEKNQIVNSIDTGSSLVLLFVEAKLTRINRMKMWKCSLVVVRSWLNDCHNCSFSLDRNKSILIMKVWVSDFFFYIFEIYSFFLPHRVPSPSSEVKLSEVKRETMMSLNQRERE